MMTVMMMMTPIVMFMALSSWHSHYNNSPGSFAECRLSAVPILRISQSTWTVSLTVGCYRPDASSPFIIITQLESWCSFYNTREVRRLSRPSTAVKREMIEHGSTFHNSQSNRPKNHTQPNPIQLNPWVAQTYVHQPRAQGIPQWLSW